MAKAPPDQRCRLLGRKGRRRRAQPVGGLQDDRKEVAALSLQLPAASRSADLASFTLHPAQTTTPGVLGALAPTRRTTTPSGPRAPRLRFGCPSEVVCLYLWRLQW